MARFQGIQLYGYTVAGAKGYLYILLFNKLLLHGLRIRGLCLGRVYILLICSKRVSTTVLISKYNIIGCLGRIRISRLFSLIRRCRKLINISI